MHIMHIHYFCTYYAYYAYHDFSFPFAGHNDCMVIFKSAAYYMPCLMRTWKKSCLATMNLFSGLIYPVFWLSITSFL